MQTPKKYSKTKLTKFRKSIEAKLNDVAHEMSDIKDTLDTNTRGNSSKIGRASCRERV